MMKKMIVCKTCGAEYEESLVRCPYCGTGYAPAEEDEYMEKLEGVRQDLHRQIDKGNTRIRKGMSSTFRVILIVIAAVLLLLFGGLWFSGSKERSRSGRKKEEFLQNQGITTQQEATGDDM